MKWKRYRFYTHAVDDHRPLVFNPKYPWWCSGSGGEDEGAFDVIVAYLPADEDLLKYWDDAYDVDFDEKDEITFSDRFAKPDYFEES